MRTYRSWKTSRIVGEMENMSVQVEAYNAAGRTIERVGEETVDEALAIVLFQKASECFKFAEELDSTYDALHQELVYRNREERG